MRIRPEDLRAALSSADRPLGSGELLRALGLPRQATTGLKRALRDAVRSGLIVQKGKRFELPGLGATAGRGPAKASAKPIEGTFHAHRDGFGFVHPLLQEGENIFVPPGQARRVLHGDRVAVEVRPGPGGRKVGHVVEVLERRRQLVVGRYLTSGNRAFVQPLDGGEDVRVPATQLARSGDLVKVRLGVGAGLLGPGGLVGEVAGSMGREDDASVEVLAIAYALGFHDEFPAQVMDEVDRVPLEVSSEEARAEGRRDLRALPLVTIDGEDARDFDDAIFVEAHPQGHRLLVAVADVAHYVAEATALDGEAYRRATSVYLPGRVLPMLPERLSNGICSLMPEVDRLCMVADMVVSPSGQTVKAELYPAVMRSAARCTYNEVHAVLAGVDVPGRTQLRPLFERALEVSRVLTAMRERRGAIDFDLPETRIELNDQGLPVRLVRRDRLESHRVVEECMLAANEAVARYFHQRHLPTVYRFHGEPDEDKLAAFAALAAAHGFFLPMRELTSADLNLLLEKLEDHPEQRALNQLLLRSMMQATYSAREVGHYGLAAEHYLHFTSPIRRYPDLLVHRLLKAAWAGGRASEAADREVDRLDRMAALCSERERAAMQVERDVVAFYAALLMKDRVGEEFEGTVSALSDKGFFVELDELLVEGMVRGESLSVRFRFDPLSHSLVLGAGRRVRVGQRVRVRLDGVNLRRRQLELLVVRFAAEAAADHEVSPAKVEHESRRRVRPGHPRRPKDQGRGKRRRR